jgi:hypothetical protein
MFICDGFENGGKVLRIRCRGCEDITLISINDLDLSTLVEVCYVDGEEMVVGVPYRVRNHNNDKWNEGHLFVGVLKGLPFFRFAAGVTSHQWDHWEKSPVPTYHLVKSIDGKEVSRVEVSGEKAKELGE